MKMLAALCALLFAPQGVDVTEIFAKFERWLDLQLAAYDGGTDAGSPSDAGQADAGVDASTVDAGPPDSGIADSGKQDSGTSSALGFYVAGRKLYDANGAEFTIRGTNKTHQDAWSPGLGKTKSNTTRWLVYFTSDPARALKDMQSANIGGTTANGRAVQIPGFWDGTCKSDQATFETMVSRWVSWLSRSDWQAFARYAIPNVANEWGSNETAWRDAYIAAIPRLRAAGWRGTIMVDAPGCGQNGMAIVRHGAAILAADPLRNLLFSWHVYGLVYDSQGGIARQYAEQIDLIPTMDALVSSGLAVVIGEFGPGRNIGPSPTMITPQRVLDAAEARGIGTLSWSWDDNDGPNGTSTNNGFSHSYSGNYDSAADLTDFGKVMVAHWDQYAKPASIFGPAAAPAPSALRSVLPSAPSAPVHPPTATIGVGKRLH